MFSAVVLTGLYIIGVHALKFKMRLEEAEVESPEHFLIDYIAFARSSR